jgi:streptogramin lyase
MPAFYAQAPQSDFNPWVLYVGSSTGASRVTGVEGKTTPAFAGVELLTFGPPSTANDLAFDALGNMWIARTGLSRIDANAPAGAVVVDVRFTGLNWPEIPAGVIVAPNGDVWCSNYVTGAGGFRMVTAANVAASVGAGPLDIVPDVIITSPQILGCQNIIMDFAGNIWASCFENPSIVMIAAADLTTSGSKTASIVLQGGGHFGNGTTIGPATIRFFEAGGPLR